MKQILVGVLAFVLALGGASAFSIMKAKGAAEVAVAEGSAGGAGESTGDADGSAVGKDLPPEPDSDPVGADSTGTGLEGEDLPAAGGAGTQFAATELTGDASVHPAGVSGDAGSGDRAAGAAGAAGSPDPAESGPVSDLNPEGIRRMARIFGAMKPQEAAAVLQRMSDEEVRGVMLQMGDRPAAAILSVFDPERAAALSRVVLGRRGAP